MIRSLKIVWQDTIILSNKPADRSTGIDWNKASRRPRATIRLAAQIGRRPQRAGPQI